MSALHRIGTVGCCAVAVAATLAAVAPAAPAAADLLPPADGYYSYHEAGKPQADWVLQAICIQPNGTRAQEDYSDITVQTLGCTVNVGSSTAKNTTPDEALLNTNARARLTSGRWAFSNVAGEIACDDGGTAAVTDNFEFDAATLTGTRTTLWGAACDRQPGMTKVPFTLSFTGPLEPPTENRFPDTCNYLVGRPSICS